VTELIVEPVAEPHRPGLNGGIKGHRERMKDMGIADPKHIFIERDLAPGPEIILAAGGVTDGSSYAACASSATARARSCAEVMRKSMETLTTRGTVVISESERDEALMLFIDEKLRRQHPDDVDLDIAVLKSNSAFFINGVAYVAFGLARRIVRAAFAAPITSRDSRLADSRERRL
jgi:fructose-1,6-bisphosphatase/sedoheptulose 1,7-bisphosphatase-like protein